MSFPRISATSAFLFVVLFTASMPAQQNRISSRIDPSRIQRIVGSTPLQAGSASDIGIVDPSLRIENVTLLLKPAADRQKALEQLLAAQQDPSSPEYRQWLTPEEYANRFGMSETDLETIGNWLRSMKLGVDQVARGRNWIQFSGTAGQMQSAFSTPIHRYQIGDQVHFANVTDVSIPAVLAGIVAGVRGLDDFRMTPNAPRRMIDQANFTSSTGSNFLVPDDIAVIYGLNALYARGINGAGQKIVVAGQSALRTGAGNTFPDLDGFRSQFNLPANTPQVFLTGESPGIVPGDIDESTLDMEWAGAVARNSALIFVYAKNVLNAVQYAIDQNLAPVISFSYGDCEQRGSAAYQVIAQQANVQGITWLASSGDSGAAACDNQSATIAAAKQGISVSFPASFPEVTGVGGTRFVEGSGAYWDSVNGANGGSALSYIPEMAWNDSAAVGFLEASGGGASAFFPKPVWQVGPGVPGDGARDVPDVSFASSPQHAGYRVYNNGQFQIYGGTSAAAPLFSGVVALLNQSLTAAGLIAKPGLGNINPVLYKLAATNPEVFHDVTAGNNIVPCVGGTADCATGSYGYTAGPGYDQVTGLGSVDANALVTQWTVPFSSSSAVTLTVSPNPVYQTVSSAGAPQWRFTIMLSEAAGKATTLTNFTFAGTNYSSQINSFFGSSTLQAFGTLSAALSINSLSASQAFTVSLSGADPGGKTWSQQVSVPFLTVAAASPQISGLTNGASFQQIYAPGMIMSVFGSQLAGGAAAAAALPLPASMQGASVKINGIIAPLYYVSPGQLNIQIPYEAQPGPATLTLTSSGQTATASFTVTANAPGIFAGTGNVLVPYASGKVGSTLLLFMTGDGALTPFLSDGATPPATTPFLQLPKPIAAVTVTVGGIAAPVAFIGVPNGLAGATQINFVVPSGVSSGTHPVVVTVGGIATPAVNLTVTN